LRSDALRQANPPFPDEVGACVPILFQILELQLEMFALRHKRRHLKKGIEPYSEIVAGEEVVAQKGDKVRERLPKEERNVRYSTSGRAMSVREICIVTSFAEVPTNVLILRFYLIVLKNISI